MNRLLASPRLLATLQYAGYVLFFLVVLVLAVPATFPTRQLKAFVARQARAQGYPLEIEELRLKGLGGIEVGGIKLTLPGKPGEAGGEGVSAAVAVPEAELQIDKLTARVSVLPWLFGRTVDLSFDVEAGGGRIEGGRLVRKGEVIDVEIGNISDLSLGEMGIGARALSAQRQLGGELDGDLAGKVKMHWGGTADDLNGSVDLELADAVLKNPELALQGGLKLTDLALGAVTLKVRMNLKANIAALANQRGAEKATVIHIEQMEAIGDQLELVTEETSHILVPPGKGGFKAATIQVHFAFSLTDKKAKAAGKDAAAKEGAKAKDEASDKEQADRLKWSAIMQMFGNKLKPFERGGFIGVTCTGPLARPQCRLALPEVTVGTRGGATKLEGAPTGAPARPAGEAPAPETPPTPGPSPEQPMEFRPAVRPEAAPVPTVQPDQPPPPPQPEQPDNAQPQPPPEQGQQPPPEAQRPAPAPERPVPPPQRTEGEPPPEGGERPAPDPNLQEELPPGDRSRQDPSAPPPEGGEPEHPE